MIRIVLKALLGNVNVANEGVSVRVRVRFSVQVFEGNDFLINLDSALWRSDSNASLILCSRMATTTIH